MIGYDFLGATESLEAPNFSVSGIACAAYFAGNPTATACATDGKPYALSGCHGIKFDN